MNLLSQKRVEQAFSVKVEQKYFSDCLFLTELIFQFHGFVLTLSDCYKFWKYVSVTKGVPWTEINKEDIENKVIITQLFIDYVTTMTPGWIEPVVE